MFRFFFLISKKKILLIKEKQEKQKEFTSSEQWKKETTRQKQPLIHICLDSIFISQKIEHKTAFIIQNNSRITPFSIDE